MHCAMYIRIFSLESIHSNSNRDASPVQHADGRSIFNVNRAFNSSTVQHADGGSTGDARPDLPPATQQDAGRGARYKGPRDQVRPTHACVPHTPESTVPH